MSTHLHCPACDHCADAHQMSTPRPDGLPTRRPTLTLRCIACPPDTEFVCPAIGQDRQDILRFMFITSMIDSIETVGL